MRAAAILALVLSMSGCGIPPALIGAGLGFGTAALRLDTVAFQWWIDQRAPSPTMPAAWAPSLAPVAAPAPGAVVVVPAS